MDKRVEQACDALDQYDRDSPNMTATELADNLREVMDAYGELSDAESDILTIAYMKGAENCNERIQKTVELERGENIRLAEKICSDWWRYYKHGRIEDGLRANPHTEGRSDGAEQVARAIERRGPARTIEDIRRDEQTRIAKHLRKVAPQFAGYGGVEAIDRILDTLIESPNGKDSGDTTAHGEKEEESYG